MQQVITPSLFGTTELSYCIKLIHFKVTLQSIQAKPSGNRLLQTTRDELLLDKDQ